MHRGALLSRGIAFCWLVVLSVCLGMGAQEKRDTAQPPAPRAEDEELRKSVGAPVDPKTYIIGPEDVLKILVWREPDLSGPVGVRPDGMITLPLMGDVQAGGLTPEKLAERLTEGFKKNINNPEVMVSVRR